MGKIYNKFLRISLTIIIIIFTILTYPLSKMAKDDLDEEEVKNNE